MCLKNKYEYLYYPKIVPITSSSLSLPRKYMQIVLMDEIVYWKWKGLEGVEGRENNPDGRGGKIQRNIPGVPILPEATSVWSSTTETAPKGGQREKTPL